ncbi:hypothetical protein C8F04DRAFT_1236633 [Mycena alexandri]|uniref:Uncharacterized protein n=1 Tax=Mycena alexandri TaxID=1745969 RepID=A0AAD6SM09_9AGAR|nr:hypothetical protein C8F04DRAFT_1236633 [Mycena alexandri]
MMHSSISSSPSLRRLSLYTTTSSSTQWGPGAVSGKAVLAMGKAVVRGAEHLIILRRLAAIEAAMPCVDTGGTQSDLSLENMFADLLELSRTLYREAIRIQAMQIIVVQIATEQTQHFRLSISKWEIDCEELEGFLNEIVAIALFSHRGCCDDRLSKVYIASLSKDLHPWSACIGFLSQLAQLNADTFQAVINTQLLEILIWVSARQLRTGTDDPRVEAYCNVVYAVLSTPLFREQDDLRAAQLARYCPDESSTSSVQQVIANISGQEQWLAVERRLLEKHVRAMLNTLGCQFMSNSDFGEIFRGSQLGVPRLADAPPSLPAIRNLLWCIGIGGDVQKRTEEYLSTLSQKRKVFVLDRLIRDLVIQFLVQPATPYSKLTQTPQFIAHAVQFFLGLSTASPCTQDAVADAAILNILPFLEPSWKSEQMPPDRAGRQRDKVPRTRQLPGRLPPCIPLCLVRLHAETRSKWLFGLVGTGSGTFASRVWKRKSGESRVGFPAQCGGPSPQRYASCPARKSAEVTATRRSEGRAGCARGQLFSRRVNRLLQTVPNTQMLQFFPIFYALLDPTQIPSPDQAEKVSTSYIVSAAMLALNGSHFTDAPPLAQVELWPLTLAWVHFFRDHLPHTHLWERDVFSRGFPAVRHRRHRFDPGIPSRFVSWVGFPFIFKDSLESWWNKFRFWCSPKIPVLS